MQCGSEMSKSRTNIAIARRGNETDETEVLGSLPVNVEVRVGICKTTVNPFIMMKE
jgi:hypothetical protein